MNILCKQTFNKYDKSLFQLMSVRSTKIVSKINVTELFTNTYVVVHADMND